MHRSQSVSRQGTFDTGPAQPDKRGSIWRGDVELPIVGESSGDRQNSTDKSQNDSGLSSQSPASKERSPSSDRGLPNRFVQSRDSSADKAEDEDSPRYVDHNKLFPEASEEQRWEGRDGLDPVTRVSQYSVVDKAKSRTRREDNGNRSHGHTPRVLNSEAEPDIKKSPRLIPQREKSPSNHDSPNKRDNKTGSEEGPKVIPTQPDRGQELETSTGEPPPATLDRKPSPESVTKQSHDVEKQDQQAARNTALARLKAKKGAGQNQPASDEHSEKPPNSSRESAKEPNNPKPYLSEDNQHSPRHNQRSPRQNQHSPKQGQHPPRQGQHSPRQNQHSPRQSQHSPRQNQHPPRQGQHSPRQNQHSPGQNLHSPRQGQHSSRQNQHSPSQSQHSPRQNLHPPKQDQHSPRQNPHSPQQGQHSPKQNQHSLRQNPHSPSQSQHSPRQNLHSPRQNQHSPSQSQHTPRQNPHSPQQNQHSLEQNQHKKKQQPSEQSQLTPTTSEKKTAKPEPGKENDSTIKALTANLAPSLATLKKQQLQQDKQQNDSKQPKETTGPGQTKEGDSKEPASSGAPVAGPSQKTFQEAFLEQTPHVQPNPFLLSTHERSDPPLDHIQTAAKHKVSNSASRKRDTPRDKETGKAATPSPEREGTSGLKSARSKSSSRTDNSRPKSGMSTMAERPQRGGGDSLSEVTLERDQLLKNERTYKQRILQLEEEVKSVVKQSQELSAENRLLQNKMEAFETKAYGGSLELKEMRREKQDLQAMVAKTTGEKQQADFDNERLQARLSEIDSKSKQWDSLYVENNKLKTKQAELEKRIQDLDKEKQALRNGVKTAESTQMDKVAAVQNENKKLQADLINLQTKNNSMERKVERLESENKELAERMEQKRDELDELMRAMKAETNVEVELKEVNTELEFAKNKLADYKKDIDEANHRNEVLEKEKDAAKNSLRLKESEFKGVKANSEEKDTQIGELKRQVDAAKRNVKRLEDDLEDTRQVEKDVVNMKARIRSLKNEIEDSLSANHKMKQERTEARLEAERLNRELAATTEGMNEARRYIKKLEGERGSRDKLEEELKIRKQREVELERQAYDMNVKNDQLRQKVRELEEDKEILTKNRSGLTEVEAANRKLLDENKKLRQMLVERNMEIVQRQSERVALIDRLDNVESKQNDSDIKVQQLKGWVDTVHTYAAVPAVSHQAALKPQPQPQPKPYTHPHPHPQALVTLPPVSSHAAPRQARAGGGGGGGGDRGRRKKNQQHQNQQRQNQLNRSWEDFNRLKVEQDDSVRTTPSLPVVLDAKIVPTTGQGPPGYYDLYRSKMKLIRERKW